MKANPQQIRNPKSEIRNRTCSACGAEARRINAKFCLICGKLLREDYQPLDTIRSSYRLQGQSFLMENQKSEEITDLFQRNENTVSETAWACFVYSMVPYIGILFIPFTFIIGLFGVAVSYQRPHLGGRKLALISMGMSFIVLLIQIFLWWLLYLIPEISKGF
ncbi:MAG: hypothetical protein R2747_12930 [Pyrinomonadaceae bacterium]